MKITSTAFQEGEEIPSKYTCEGNDISPPLSWQNVPDNAKSLVLIVEDPDAPDPAAPKMTWIHWVLYNIETHVLELQENVERLPMSTIPGLSSWNNKKYGGPCPPIGRHRYYHRLYALDKVLAPIENPTANNVRAAMRGHVIEEAVLMGTYQKKK